MSKLLSKLKKTPADMHKTQLFYDEDMLKHESRYQHVECPDRISKSRTALKTFGIDKNCEILEPKLATTEQLLLTHSKSHVNNVLTIKRQGNFDSGLFCKTPLI